MLRDGPFTSRSSSVPDPTPKIQKVIFRAGGEALRREVNSPELRGGGESEAGVCGIMVRLVLLLG